MSHDLIDEALDAVEPHSGADLIKMIGRLVDALDDVNTKYNTLVAETRDAARGLTLRPTQAWKLGCTCRARPPEEIMEPTTDCPAHSFGPPRHVFTHRMNSWICPELYCDYGAASIDEAELRSWSELHSSIAHKKEGTK